MSGSTVEHLDFVSLRHLWRVAAPSGHLPGCLHRGHCPRLGQVSAPTCQLCTAVRSTKPWTEPKSTHAALSTMRLGIRHIRINKNTREKASVFECFILPGFFSQVPQRNFGFNMFLINFFQTCFILQGLTVSKQRIHPKNLWKKSQPEDYCKSKQNGCGPGFVWVHQLSLDSALKCQVCLVCRGFTVVYYEKSNSVQCISTFTVIVVYLFAKKICHLYVLDSGFLPEPRKDKQHYTLYSQIDFQYIIQIQIHNQKIHTGNIYRCDSWKLLFSDGHPVLSIFQR